MLFACIRLYFFVVATIITLSNLSSQAQLDQQLLPPVSSEISLLPPTSHGLRVSDCKGQGHFGARRVRDGTIGRHNGEDYITIPGEPIYASMDGVAERRRPDFRTPRLDSVNIYNGRYVVKLMYVEPAIESGEYVRKGDIIGYAQDISGRYGYCITQHVHAEFYIDDVVVPFSDHVTELILASPKTLED